MHPCLLKKLLPFALTFIVGATIGGLFKSRVTTQTSTERTTLMLDHGGYGYGRSCRMYRRDLVAETKPLLIKFKPEAHWPRELRGIAQDEFLPVYVHVIFGADGKVQKVQPPNDSDYLVCCHNWPKARVWQAAADAAQNIQFEPEMINSVPVSVEKDVEIHFIND
jgi:hypothetical protein